MESRPPPTYCEISRNSIDSFTWYVAFQSHELDETLKRLGQHGGVLGTIVVNAEGELRLTISLQCQCSVQFELKCCRLSRYRREDHAGCCSDCSVHRPHLGDNKASKTFRFYNRWVIALRRTLCLVAGSGHGAKYRPGQWPDIPETEVLQIFATRASDHCHKCFVSRSKKNEILIAPGWRCDISKCWCWQYICRPGLYPDRGAAGRRPSAQHRRPGQGGVNSEQFGE